MVVSNKDLIPIGLVLGGGYYLYQEFNNSEELNWLQDYLEKVDSDIKDELDGDVSEDELDNHITYYSDTSSALYAELDENLKSQIQNPDEMENEVADYTKEEKALAWKHYAESVAAIREMEVSGETILDDNEWVIIAIGLGAFGAAAYSYKDFITSMVDKWRDSDSDTDTRAQFASAEFLNDMIEGGTEAVAEDPEGSTRQPPQPIEGRSPEVVAEARWAEVATALPGSLAGLVVTYWNLESNTQIKVYEYAPEIVAEMTGENVEWFLDQPIAVQVGLVILLLIFAKAIAAFGTAGAIGAAAGKGASSAIAGGLFITLGVRIDREEVKDHAKELAEEVEII